MLVASYVMSSSTVSQRSSLVGLSICKCYARRGTVEGGGDEGGEVEGGEDPGPVKGTSRCLSPTSNFCNC